MKLLVLLACVAMARGLASPSSSLIIHPRVCTSSKSIPTYKQCLVDLFKRTKPYLIKGTPEFNLPSLSPYRQQGEFRTKLEIPGAFNLDIELQNFVADGFDKAELKTVSFDPVASSGGFMFTIPYVKVKSNYDLKGDLLGKYTEDNGKLQVNLENIVLALSWTYKRVDKSGVDYIQVPDLSLKFLVENGNAKVASKDPILQILGDTLIKFFNENPQRVLSFAYSMFGEVAETFVKNKMNEMLFTIPANEILPQ